MWTKTPAFSESTARAVDVGISGLRRPQICGRPDARVNYAIRTELIASHAHEGANLVRISDYEWILKRLPGQYEILVI
jgi:hypothetical protein